MKKILLGVLMLAYVSIMAQGEKIQWLKFEEAVAKNEKEPRKFIVDVYTHWCGWCKRMDQTTFNNPKVVKYINEKFWAVKLNAERKDSIILGQQLFVNEYPNRKRNAHQLAIALLNGKMSYPTVVYLDENVDLLTQVAGYVDAKTIEPILHWFGENAYLTTPFEEFRKSFKGKTLLTGD